MVTGEVTGSTVTPSPEPNKVMILNGPTILWGHRPIVLQGFLSDFCLTFTGLHHWVMWGKCFPWSQNNSFSLESWAEFRNVYLARQNSKWNTMQELSETCCFFQKEIHSSNESPNNSWGYESNKWHTVPLLYLSITCSAQGSWVSKSRHGYGFSTTGCSSHAVYLKCVCRLRECIKAKSVPSRDKHLFNELWKFGFLFKLKCALQINRIWLFSRACLVKTKMWHKLFFIILLANALQAPLDFNSFSHSIYSKICQVNTLRGDDLAVANSNLWHLSNPDS